MKYPIITKKPTVLVHHGDRRVDDYDWMKNKTDPNVLEYLNNQNEYTAISTKSLLPLQDEIYTEIKSRVKETDLSVPVRVNNFWYLTRTKAGESYPIHTRIPVNFLERNQQEIWTPPTIESEDYFPQETVILNENELAAGKDFFALGGISLSRDGNTMVYAIDVSGNERYTLYSKDLVSDAPARKLVEDVSSDICVSPDGNYLFYVSLDSNWRSNKLWRLELTPAKLQSPILLYEEVDEKFWISFGISRSEVYYFLTTNSKISSETYFLPVEYPNREFTRITPRKTGIEYCVEHARIGSKDYFLKISNAKNPNFSLSAIPISKLDKEINIFIGDSKTRIETVDAFSDKIVLGYRSAGISKLAVAQFDCQKNFDLSTLFFKELNFDEKLYSVTLAGNPNWESPYLRISYSSYLTPTKIMDYELQTNTYILLKQQEISGEYDRNLYEQNRIWITSKDGENIPVSLVKRKEVAYPAPMVLYGYGAYEISLDPAFSVSRLSLLDRGVIYAEAHVRGGGELGRAWYDAGKQLQKQNTFNDFIDCANFLINEKYTDSSCLVAYGGSAGGLLMGVVANQASQLFNGILAVVPFVDPLTSILNPDLPLTIIEWDEWGNPLEDKQVYDYIKSYSPYENVIPQNYPAILAVTSLNDTRVLYVEPAKWIAKLQQNQLGEAPILLKTDMSAGHGGVSGRYAAWKELAFKYAWILSRLNTN